MTADDVTTADDVSALVRRALAELVTPPPRRALVLFTGALIGFERVIGELDLLVASGVELEYVQTPSAERILDQRLIASVPMRPADRHLTGSHDTLVVATLTQNAAAKTAHGIADCLASNLLNDYLLAGRPVVAAASGCDPDDPDKRRWFPTIPEGLAAVMRENLETLRGFGVRTARAGALARTVLAAYERAERARTAPLTTALGMSRRELLDRLGAPAPATPVAVGGRAARAAAAPAPRTGAVSVQLRLISQRVVQRLPVGTVMRVPAGAQITAMAADVARTRSVTIIREA
ncbi:flavoprotein [Propionibacterium acidifaciens]|uniref:flavoprotein n=1 Tax=Propionibacterium acidifaciens TaxID=556499 RepID=UPI0028DC40A9|nr:flavoprotein [Propionibacterium acidifaciens]